MDSNRELREIIHASSLNRYSFCRRAWWLEQVMNMEPENREALRHGREAHREHGSRVAAGERWNDISLVLMAAGALLVVLTFLLALLGHPGGLF